MILWPFYIMLVAPLVGHEPDGPGYKCTLFIAVIAVFISPVMFGVLRSKAPLVPRWIGVSAMFCCTLIGSLNLHFLCPGTSFEHLMLWHYLPSIMIPLVLMKFYEKAFDW